MPPPFADDVRQSATDTYGTVPNLLEETCTYTGIAGAVYLAADAALMNGNLRPREQQAVLLTMARYDNSRYDAVVHARMALDAGLPPRAVDQLLAGDSVSDERLQVLVEVTLRSCEERGWLDAETLRDFERRGVGRGELYEIFAFIGLKTFTAYTDHLSVVDVDGPLRSLEQSLDHLPDEPDVIKRQRLFLG